MASSLTLSQLKDKILALFARENHTKSPSAEADRILFHVYRGTHPKAELKELALLMHHPVSSFTSTNAFSKALGATDSQDLENFSEVSQFENSALELAHARTTGIPLQHLLGEQYFYHHEYQVNKSVLIPRPETEILISEIFSKVKDKFKNGKFRFAELGVGSGILSTEILAEFPQAAGIGSELSSQSIEVARKNLRTIVGENWEERFQLMESLSSEVGFEIFGPKAPFDLILSNPPYVSIEDEIEEEVLHHEPHMALFPETVNDEPNYFYFNFLAHEKNLLTPEGVAFFEIPHERAEELREMFQQSFSNVKLIKDLTNRYRVLACSHHPLG
jgi:release factor glutamine methyltransferase